MGPQDDRLDGISHWVEMLTSDDEYERRHGWAQLYPRVDEFLRRRVERQFKNALQSASIADVAQDAVLAAVRGLAGKRLEDGPPGGTTYSGCFRGFIVRVAWNKAIDRLRERRRARDARARVAVPAAAPADPGYSVDDLDNLQAAFVRLERHELTRGGGAADSDTPLTDALRARLLIDIDARFYLDGAAVPDPVAAAGVRTSERTYEEVGELVGCSGAEAYRRCKAGFDWLHRNHPEVVPALTRRATGRKKSGGGA